MKTKLSCPILKNLLDCFFLLENKNLSINNYCSAFCMFQHNRELKQLIKILSTSQRKNYKKSSKLLLVVLHVEDLVAQKFLTILIDRCKLKLKVQVEIVGSPSNRQVSTHVTTLNLYFVEHTTLNFLHFKHTPLSVVFSPRGYNSRVGYSGCYSVSFSAFDTKLFIFVVAVLTSFLTKDYEKTNKI